MIKCIPILIKSNSLRNKIKNLKNKIHYLSKIKIKPQSNNKNSLFPTSITTSKNKSPPELLIMTFKSTSHKLN